MESEKYTNELIHESSPYLLQHAHNPVNWVAWSPEVFRQAKQEDKLVLVSVGYSACHWCHVMEHESFEDTEVAALMNKFFICVKVDREERPDVDQVYMNAVQLMTQQGGWPLNCFTLPDGRPVYGGTYFQKEQWMHVLRSLEQTYRKDRDKVLEYAGKLHEGINRSELIDVPAEDEMLKPEKLHELVQRWAARFDYREGGPNSAPKFMLPNNFAFLLRYGHHFRDEKILGYVELSLDKMAMGGIYDQAGGGFSRYSTDVLWKVPHFEKMLYDNGQLIALYAMAWQKFKKPLYKRVVYDTITWLEREMLSPDDLFYSALDADSEGEEGKFYVWSERELREALGKEYTTASQLYEFSRRSEWEGKYILLRVESDHALQRKIGLNPEELDLKIAEINELLRSYRNSRVRPGTDDKCLTSWNAMAVSGLALASVAFDEPEFLLMARKVMRSLLEKVSEEDALWRNYKNGKRSVPAFLEDYAHVIAALLDLYEATMDEDYVERARLFAERARSEFQHPESELFYFTGKDTELISRKMELHDNVIPSSNSVMANNLFLLGHLLQDETYLSEAKQMLLNVYDGMEHYGSGYSNWSNLLLDFCADFKEITVVGPDYVKILAEIQREFRPLTLLTAGNPVKLPVGAGKGEKEGTWIYVCREGICEAPVRSLE